MEKSRLEIEAEKHCETLADKATQQALKGESWSVSPIETRRDFQAGARALLEYARTKAVRPEPKSMTQFDPLVLLSDLEAFCGEGE